MKQMIANVSFYPIKPGETEFLRHRHPIESLMYKELAVQHELVHVRVLAAGALGWDSEGQKFFRGRAGLFFIPFRLCFYVRRLRPKVVIIHSFLFPVQVLFLRLILPRSTRYVVQHHSEKPWTRGYRKILQRAVYRHFDLYLFCSRELADEFVKAGSVNPAKVAELMELSTAMQKIDKAEARRLLGIPEGPVVLWVGRLIGKKDPMTFLKALQLVKDLGCTFRCYMLFGAEDLLDDVRTFILDHDLGDRVVLAGRRPHSELPQWFSAADYFVSASLYESMGVAVCEAMACGCVPVVTNIGPFRYMTKNGSGAYLFQPGDHAQLAEHLKHLLKGTALPLKERPREVFRNHLCYEAVSKRLAALIDDFTAA